MNWRTLALIGCLLSASAAAAQTNGLEVKDAWARATAGKPGDGAVYLTIMSSAPDRLVSASAAVANKSISTQLQVSACLSRFIQIPPALRRVGTLIIS